MIPVEDDFPYARAVLLFSTAVLAVLTFAGLYFDVRITLISLPLLVFLAVLFLGWSGNECLNRGEMRRAIAATLVATFIVLVLGSEYVAIPSELRNYFLGVLSTIIGFYFGYRGRETEEERMERIIRGLSGVDNKIEGGQP
ncbi:hypothetical protein [Thermococcus sp.]|uniref:hypothetical protein n=1 Tax=Thermococcus sp. TaxID=35749 RepID=UPI0025F5F486|nr:hypothetical protein [Thermococcus sp.]